MKIWGGDYEAYYDCTNAVNGEFNGKIGYATKLHKTYAFARFVTSRTVLDSTAFNEQKTKVDASRPSDIQNIRTYSSRFGWDADYAEGYAQPKQWKVNLKYFAASYTFKADDSTTKTVERDTNFGYGSQDQEVGLTLGSGGKATGVIIAAKYNGVSGNDHNYNQAQNFSGSVGFGPWWRDSNMIDLTKYDRSKGQGWCWGLKAGEEHTILVTGTYDESSQTAKISCYIDGNLADIFVDSSGNRATTETIKNFDGYVGWMTHVKDVKAVARFWQWDESESYFSLGADALDYRTRGPVLGYWKREISKESLNWGLQQNEKYDGVTITSTYDHYDHPDANMYQLGQLASTDRDFYMTVTLTYDGQQQGLYLCAEEPRDNRTLSYGEEQVVQVGNSTVGNDPDLMGGNAREWYSKYIAVIIDGSGNLCIWNNRGNYGYNPKGANYKDTVGLGLNKGEQVRLKVVYKNKTIEIYANKASTLDRYQDPTTWRYTYTLSDADIHGTTFGLWSKNELDRNNNKSPYYSKDITFGNIKVSYGLQSPLEVNAVKEVLGDATGTTGTTEKRNKHLAGFVQTREATNGDSNCYDLRVMIEGDDWGFRRQENYDAIITVKFTNSGGEFKYIDGYAHHIAYTEYSFYDAEYYFHAADGNGMLSLVINNIPKSYSNIEVYVVFLEGHTWGVAGDNNENIKEKVRIGSAKYENLVDTPNFGGTPAPNDNNGANSNGYWDGYWEYKH